jgi:cation:H+ antiporter
MIGVSLLFWVMATDGRMSRLDGAILVAGLILFIIWMIRSARGSSDIPGVEAPSPEEAERTGPTARILLLTGGIVALAIGARLMVDSAVSIAHLLEIQPVVIGLTIVAIGTSLPELAASMACAFKKESDMSVGNIVGSNMLNILFVVGVVSLVQPVEVESTSIRIHFPVMLGISLLLYPLARSGYKLSRVGGTILLTAFVAYMGYLIYPYIQ